MTLRTWHVEALIVAIILAAVNIATHSPPAAWVGALAVLLSFGHVSVAARMEEKHASTEMRLLRMTSDSEREVVLAAARKRGDLLDCYRWLRRYLVGKELCWVVYFLATRSYPALVGCGVFLAYPLWRRWWRSRRRHPRGEQPPAPSVTR